MYRPMRQIILVLTLFLLVNNRVFGQKTPQELGQLVFKVFKYNETAVLDTLTPTHQEILDIYKSIDSTFQFPDDFIEKYNFHDQRFKNKCKRIMTDTAVFKIDWRNI